MREETPMLMRPTALPPGMRRRPWWSLSDHLIEDEAEFLAVLEVAVARVESASC